MDYIFKDWEKRLSAFESSVGKELAEIRKCKSEMLQMKLDMVAEMQKGHYIRDDQRLVLSAPEIVIGNVDRNGTLLSGGSTVVIRGANVNLQGAGTGGQVEMRAASIREIAEDPGIDGQEHVVGTVSEVVSLARNVVIQSNDAEGAFSAVTAYAGGSGVRIHADQTIDIDAAVTAESREKQLDGIISSLEKQKTFFEKQAASHKEGFQKLVEDMEKRLEERDKMALDVQTVRAKYLDIDNMNGIIESVSMAITQETYAYGQVLAQLAEISRQIKCFNKEKSKIKKGDDFKKASTGARVNVTGETINLTSADGENNLRDNKGAGIRMTANELAFAAIEHNGQLKKEGRMSVKAKNIEMATVGMADAAYDDKHELTKATYAAEGDFVLKSKNITMESVDYEVADKKLKEKQLTPESNIKLRAKTIEVSTEGSANVEVDDKGKLTKANYTAEGDIIIKSKTLSVESIDNDIENGKAKEKALTKDGKVSIRVEKMDISATDTEGKATGSVNINAKAVAVKAMDVEKEKRTDSKLAEGSTMTLVAEKMYLGAKSKEIKSKKLQAVSEEVGLFADNTLEAQQGEGKAVVQLAGGNAALGGGKTELYGGPTEVKGELKGPKGTFDAVEAKSALKTPNISDGMAAGGGGGSLSAKLKTEDAPKE